LKHLTEKVIAASSITESRLGYGWPHTVHQNERYCTVFDQRL